MKNDPIIHFLFRTLSLTISNSLPLEPYFQLFSSLPFHSSHIFSPFLSSLAFSLTALYHSGKSFSSSLSQTVLNISHSLSHFFSNISTTFLSQASSFFFIPEHHRSASFVSTYSFLAFLSILAHPPSSFTDLPSSSIISFSEHLCSLALPPPPFL